ncbi:MAG: hypothetical protein LKI80_00100 [Sporolactobacillus sp.]|jgi:cytochrome c biogenesis protein CcdA|nr:hypothetical protein [Sporolactobacillus sp.]
MNKRPLIMAYSFIVVAVIVLFEAINPVGTHANRYDDASVWISLGFLTVLYILLIGMSMIQNQMMTYIVATLEILIIGAICLFGLICSFLRFNGAVSMITIVVATLGILITFRFVYISFKQRINL